MDLVELSPVYDVSHMTAYLAEQVLFEMVCIVPPTVGMRRYPAISAGGTDLVMIGQGHYARAPAPVIEAYPCNRLAPGEFSDDDGCLSCADSSGKLPCRALWRWADSARAEGQAQIKGVALIHNKAIPVILPRTDTPHVCSFSGGSARTIRTVSTLTRTTRFNKSTM